MKLYIKKYLVPLLFLILPQTLLIAADFSIRVLPSYNFISKKEFSSGPGITGSLDLSVFTLRGTDNIFLSLSASWLPLKAKSIDSLNSFDVGMGLGYSCQILDRLNLDAEVTGGIWTVNGNDGIKDTSGILLGGRLEALYNIFPELSAGIFAGYQDFLDQESFLKKIQAGLSFKYNFTKGLIKSSEIEMEEQNLDNIFPVFYSYYDNHEFGRIVFSNREKSSITDVEVKIYIEEYMSNPDVCCKFDKIERNETFEVPLTAFLNETILLNLEASVSDAKIDISYKLLGKKITSSHRVEIQTLNRNNMTWEDDRRAAAFISPKDGGARFFARHVKSAVLNSLKEGIPENIQYAQAMFGALKIYGINYVIDASSAFTSNFGTASIDSLNFPYQTLLYHGGDCDDLTILNCALLESLGIETALITVPGHIFMAFDSGIPAEKASESEYIIENGKAWLPVEITLCQDKWSEAKRYGMREWKKYKEDRKLYRLKDAWEVYKPVGIPDSNIALEVPAKKAIVDAFKASF